MADAKPHVEIREYESAFELLEDLKREGITGDERKKIFDSFLDLQARTRGVPINVGFELTPLCNFDCKMCYVHLTKEQMEREGRVLSTEQWLGIMRQAVEAGMLHADLTGGECLTHPGFKEIYSYLYSQGIQISVLTNGQLITEEMADFFAQKKPVLVQITVYGSNEQAYERVTGRRAFHDVVSAIQRLRERKIQTMLTVTLSQYTQENIHELLDFLRNTGLSYGIGGVSLPARENTERDYGSYIPSADRFVELFRDEQEYTEKQAEEQAAETVQGEVDSGTDKTSDAGKSLLKIERVPKNCKPVCGVPCASGQSTCHINWKGEMQPCIPFYTVTRSVLQYGYSPAFEWIKNTMSAYRPPNECRECAERAGCKTCMAEKTSGILNGSLNRAVCRRYTRYLETGILASAAKEDCV